MFQMITGFWVTQAVGTFAELGFAEQLANGAQNARALATKAGTNPNPTYRLLRGLASVGVLVQDSGRFQLTPLGATLRADAPGLLRDMARTMMVELHWLPWGKLLEAVRTGSRQTGATLGTELFEYYDAHPDVRESFFGAMHGLSMLVASEAPKVYDASAHRELCDVGGSAGTIADDASAHRELCDVGGSAGTIAAGSLRANPQLIRGTVLDRPGVMPMATQAIAEAGLAERCRALGGDFFAEVPAADSLCHQAHPARLERRPVPHTAPQRRAELESGRARAHHRDGRTRGRDPERGPAHGPQHDGPAPGARAHRGPVRRAPLGNRLPADRRPAHALANAGGRGGEDLDYEPTDAELWARWTSRGP